MCLVLEDLTPVSEMCIADSLSHNITVGFEGSAPVKASINQRSHLTLLAHLDAPIISLSNTDKLTVLSF